MKTYDLSARSAALVEKGFISHPLSQDQQERIEKINERLMATARFLCSVTPESEEQTKAVEFLRQARFWANEAIQKKELGA